MLESCNPNNAINLITDVCVEGNNVNDSKILNDPLEITKEKTPELNKLHTDGSYGSVENDEKMDKLKIQQVQSNMKGGGTLGGDENRTSIRWGLSSELCP